MSKLVEIGKHYVANIYACVSNNAGPVSPSKPCFGVGICQPNIVTRDIIKQIAKDSWFRRYSKSEVFYGVSAVLGTRTVVKH